MAEAPVTCVVFLTWTSAIFTTRHTKNKVLSFLRPFLKFGNTYHPYFELFDLR